MRSPAGALARADGRRADSGFRRGRELVADAVARVDEVVPRGATVDLLAQLADEDVDGAVAVRRATPPHALEQLVPRQDPALLPRERVQEPELRRRELRALAVDVRLDVVGVEPKLLDRDRVPAALLGSAHAAAGRRADAGGELFHRERL